MRYSTKTKHETRISRLLHALHCLELPCKLARLRKSTTGELRMQHMAVIYDLEGIERLQSINDTIETIQGSHVSSNLLRHFFQEVERLSSKHLQNLIAKEEENANANLTSSRSPNAILNIYRRCEWATLDFKPGEAPLQFQRAAAKLPIHLSVSAELNAHDTIHHLCCRLVIVCYNVKAGQVDIFRCHLFVHLHEDGGPYQKRSQN